MTFLANHNLNETNILSVGKIGEKIKLKLQVHRYNSSKARDQINNLQNYKTSSTTYIQRQLLL